MTLKIHVSSDLHLEFDANAAPAFPKEADVIILAGDIWLADDVADYVVRVTDDHPNAKVILVLGNHEYYYQNYPDVLPSIQAALSDIPNAFVLENDSIIIDDVLFLGCTLWTGFDALPGINPAIGMRDAEANVYDFHTIQNGSAYLNGESMRDYYEQSKAWLEIGLMRKDVKTKVVITHFPPCLDVNNENIDVNMLTSYFQANCRDLIEKYQPDLWVFGHNHYSHDVRISETRLVSNQRGYPGEAVKYNEKLLIDVPEIK